jgi:hypothetical protein
MGMEGSSHIKKSKMDDAVGFLTFHGGCGRIGHCRGHPG